MWDRILYACMFSSQDIQCKNSLVDRFLERERLRAGSLDELALVDFRASHVFSRAFAAFMRAFSWYQIATHRRSTALGSSPFPYSTLPSAYSCAFEAVNNVLRERKLAKLLQR